MQMKIKMVSRGRSIRLDKRAKGAQRISCGRRRRNIADGLCCCGKQTRADASVK